MLGLSQEGLAFECGLHRTYIAHLERLVRNPSLENVEKIAAALELQVFEILTPQKASRVAPPEKSSVSLKAKTR